MPHDESAENIYYYCHHEPAGHRHLYRAWLRESAAHGLRIVLVSTYTNNGDQYQSNEHELYFNTGRLLRSLRVPLHILRQSLKKKCVIVVRRRNPIFIALLALLNKNVKLIMEMEGDRESELRYVAETANLGRCMSAAHLLYRWWRCRIEDRFSAGVASRVFVVSRTLKSIFEAKYNLPADKVILFPTGVNTRSIFFDRKLRQRTRKRLRCQGVVFVYVGSTLKWQMLERFLGIFEHAVALSKAQAIVILRDRDEELIERFRRVDGSTLFRINLPHEELNEYLNAADIGVVLRENHLLNKAAMPGKCGDYLVSGLRVAITPHVGDFAADLRGLDAGIVIDDNESDEMAARRIMTRASAPYGREALALWSQRKYGIQHHIKEYIRCIREVSAE